MNRELTDKSVYVVAGLEGYENPRDDKITTLFARLRAEARLTDGNWYLFGYRKQQTPRYYDKWLKDEECDVVFVPQKRNGDKALTDQKEWQIESEERKDIHSVFPENPTNATVDDENPKTWYFAPSEHSWGH